MHVTCFAREVPDAGGSARQAVLSVGSGVADKSTSMVGVDRAPGQLVESTQTNVNGSPIPAVYRMASRLQQAKRGAADFFIHVSSATYTANNPWRHFFDYFA